MSTQPPARRRIRLPEAAYREGWVFSVTLGTSPKRDIFTNLPWSLDCVDLLRNLSAEKKNRVFAYCLMPDHAHLLTDSHAESTVTSLVGSWKSLCYAARRRHGNSDKFWQRSFFDRALRSEEDLIATARYIVMNPVRAGLVERPRDYRLCGSFEFDLADLE